MSLLAKYTEIAGVPEKSRPGSSPLALLVDCSGSMGSLLDVGRSKWDELCLQARTLEIASVFSFDHEFHTGLAERPCGSTDMAMAFKEMRKRRLMSFIMITDGMPDDEKLALHECQGMTIEVIYVGPEPRPRFLDALASRCRGKARSLNLGDTKALPEAMKALGMGTKA